METTYFIQSKQGSMPMWVSEVLLGPLQSNSCSKVVFWSCYSVGDDMHQSFKILRNHMSKEEGKNIDVYSPLGHLLVVMVK